MSCETNDETPVISCPGPEFDICAKVGVGSQEIVITYPKTTPLDLSSYSAAFTARDHDGATLFTLTSAGSRITLGSSTGNIRFRVKPADLASVRLGDWPYTLILTPPAGEDFCAGRGLLKYGP